METLGSWDAVAVAGHVPVEGYVVTSEMGEEVIWYTGATNGGKDLGTDGR